jgi:hypothetical protein
MLSICWYRSKSGFIRYLPAAIVVAAVAADTGTTHIPAKLPPNPEGYSNVPKRLRIAIHQLPVAFEAWFAGRHYCRSVW